MGSFLIDGENFRSTPNGVLRTHAEWLPRCVTEAFSTTCAVHIERVVRIGGHPAIVAQWQSTGGSSQRYPGFDSRLAGLFTFLSFCLLANI